MATILYDAQGNAFALSVVQASDGSPILQIAPQAPPIPPPIINPTGVRGWNVTDVVKQVMGKTENRANNKGNYNPRLEFWTGLDEFCGEKHYWWRRKAASLSVIAGQQSYDLSSNGTGQANAPDCVEIEEMFTINAAPQNGPISVNPMFSPRQQVAALYGSAVGTNVPRAGYFLTPNQFQGLTFSTVPVRDTTVAFTYYAVPMNTSIALDVIPLVPPFLHWGLFYMLERRIYEFLYVDSDPRFVMANKRYEDFKVIAAKAKSFSVQEAVEMRSTGRAVSSSGGRGSGGNYPSAPGGGGNPSF